VSGTDWSPWLGNTRDEVDWVTATRVAAWNATLDRDLPVPRDGDPAPAGFHWTLCPPLARASELGPDGHARTGSFLPDTGLPRRMWAGSRLSVRGPLRVGDRVDRRSTVDGITDKEGRHGPLVFVTVRHSFVANGATVLEEEQDLVYRGAARPPAPRGVSGEARPPGRWRRTVTPTETLLFRYSALTFNGHRIHYDRPYAEQMEGYPGLVVHGPLIASMLLLLVERELPGRAIERFQFRALQPTFDIGPFEIHGNPGPEPNHIRLWSTTTDAAVAVEADAWIR